MIKAGRYTSALLLVSVGICLLLDQRMDTNYVGKLLEWWPLILILLGIEYMFINFINRSGERKVVFDFGGLFLALLISALVIGVTQSSVFSSKFIDNFSSGFSSLFDQNGMKFDKGISTVPLDETTNKVTVQNLNGKITIKPGNVQQIQITTTLYVAKMDQKEAEDIAKNSKIEYSSGSTLNIIAKGQKYSKWGIKHTPRMDLVITFPANREEDFEFRMKNGNFEASGLPVKDELKVDTTNGNINIAAINGKVDVKTTNGHIAAQEIEGETILNSTNGSLTAKNIIGNVSMNSTNGALSANDIAGSLSIKTTNGSIQAVRVNGDVATKTTNGKISMVNVNHNVTADTTNGAITVSSGTVGGEWHLDTSNGKIQISVPADGSYTVSGSSGGGISSDLPLTITKKRIEGTIGSGEHRIDMDTNGGIAVNKYKAN